MNDSTDTLLSERSNTHGDFTDNSQVAQAIKRVIQNGLKGTSLKDYQQEALDMIAHKIGRIVAGNSDFKDHWDDIAGYARLVSDRLSLPDKKLPSVFGSKKNSK